MNTSYRVESSEYEKGIYRVVGINEEVVMVKVGDLGGRRLHTGQIISMDYSEIENLEKVEMPSKNIKQKVFSEIGILPYVLRANFYRMRGNTVLNLFSLGSLSVGIVLDFLVSEYSFISSLAILIGALGFAVSMSVIYNT